MVEGKAPIEAVVLDLALRKALDVAARHESALVIAADTLVELNGRVFGKPVDQEDAGRMLREMSGRRHRVLTGLVVLDTASMQAKTILVETSVYFREITGPEIEAYLASGEPFDKAGAYGIQGLGAVFVSRIEGDYYNVAGLPIAALNRLLDEFGCCLICRHLANRRAGAPTSPTL